MKIIDAVWEKRNLGVSCYEIIFDARDTLTETEQRWNELTDRQYLVFKVPPKRVDIAEFIQSQGFRFIEASLSFSCNLRDWTLAEKFKPLCENSSHEPMKPADIEIMFAEIRKGIFKTDRIYRDSFFTREQAAQRYVNWAADMIKRGSVPYKVLYQGETVGFICGALSGVYSAFEGSGCGLFFQHEIIKMCRAKDMPAVVVDVSSNNAPVINLYLELGFKLRRILYVFVKHNP